MPSDHRLVTMDLFAPKQYWHHQRSKHIPTINIDKLITYRDVQKEFVKSVSSKLPNTPHTECSWVEFGVLLQEIAKEKIGLKIQRNHRRKAAMEDPEVIMLVEEVQKLGKDEIAVQTRRQKAVKRTKLRQKRRELSTILKNKGRQDLEKKVVEVEGVKNEGRKMFAALRVL